MGDQKSLGCAEAIGLEEGRGRRQKVRTLDGGTEQLAKLLLRWMGLRRSGHDDQGDEFGSRTSEGEEIELDRQSGYLVSGEGDDESEVLPTHQGQASLEVAREIVLGFAPASKKGRSLPQGREGSRFEESSPVEVYFHKASVRSEGGSVKAGKEKFFRLPPIAG